MHGDTASVFFISNRLYHEDTGNTQGKSKEAVRCQLKNMRPWPFGVSAGAARLRPATRVIDAREYETLVSRRQTICEFRPAKPTRKTITSQDTPARQQMDAREP